MSVRTVSLAQVLFASAESPTFPSPVARVSGTPPTVTVVVAFTVVVPVVEELITTEHEPRPFATEQLLGPTNAAVAPPEFVSENEIDVPFGAFTNPPPAPKFTFTWPTSV